MGEIFAVVSGKGGAGKTTFTAALGCEMARMGQRCVMVDADLGLRSLDAVMGLENHVTYDVMDVALGLCSLRDALIRDSLHPGLYLLPASRGYGQDKLDRFSLMDICARLRDEFDQVLLDAPAGIGEGMQRVIGCCDRALVITLPEVTSLRGAAEAARRLSALEIPGGLIVNRYRGLSALLGHCMDLDTVCEILPLPLYGVIPEDGAVQRLQGQSRPVSDGRSAAARGIRRIAAAWIEEDKPEFRQHKPPSRGRRRIVWEQDEQEAWSGSRSSS